MHIVVKENIKKTKKEKKAEHIKDRETPTINILTNTKISHIQIQGTKTIQIHENDQLQSTA